MKKKNKMIKLISFLCTVSLLAPLSQAFAGVQEQPFVQIDSPEPQMEEQNNPIDLPEDTAEAEDNTGRAKIPVYSDIFTMIKTDPAGAPLDVETNIKIHARHKGKPIVPIECNYYFYILDENYNKVPPTTNGANSCHHTIPSNSGALNLDFPVHLDKIGRYIIAFDYIAYEGTQGPFYFADLHVDNASAVYRTDLTGIYVKDTWLSASPGAMYEYGYQMGFDTQGIIDNKNASVNMQLDHYHQHFEKTQVFFSTKDPRSKLIYNGEEIPNKTIIADFTSPVKVTVQTEDGEESKEFTVNIKNGYESLNFNSSYFRLYYTTTNINDDERLYVDAKYDSINNEYVFYLPVNIDYIFKTNPPSEEFTYIVTEASPGSSIRIEDETSYGIFLYDESLQRSLYKMKAPVNELKTGPFQIVLRSPDGKEEKTVNCRVIDGEKIPEGKSDQFVKICYYSENMPDENYEPEVLNENSRVPLEDLTELSVVMKGYPRPFYTNHLLPAKATMKLSGNHRNVDLFNFDIDFEYRDTEIEFWSIDMRRPELIKLPSGKYLLSLHITDKNGETTIYNLDHINICNGFTHGMHSIYLRYGKQAYNLTPAFSTDIYDYTVNVPYETDKITALVGADTLHWILSGVPVNAPLQIGRNEFHITITHATLAELTDSYKIIVNRSENSSDPNVTEPGNNNPEPGNPNPGDGNQDNNGTTDLSTNESLIIRPNTEPSSEVNKEQNTELTENGAIKKKIRTMINESTESFIELNELGTLKENGLSLDRAVLIELTESNTDVRIKLENAIISLDAEVLNSILNSMAPNASKLDFSILPLQNSTMNEAQKNALSPNDRVYDISVLTGNRSLHRFKGNFSVSFPYTDEWKPNAAWYLNENGNKEEIEVIPDKKNKQITLKLPHLSYYVIGYKTTKIQNTDTQGIAKKILEDNKDKTVKDNKKIIKKNKTSESQLPKTEDRSLIIINISLLLSVAIGIILIKNILLFKLSSASK